MEQYKKLVVAAGNYTVQGQEKTRWIEIGRVLKSPNGFKVKLDTIPVEWNGWAEMVDIEPRQPNAKQVSKKEVVVDDMPF